MNRKAQNQAVRRIVSLIAGFVFALGLSALAHTFVGQPTRFVRIAGCTSTSHRASIPDQNGCHREASVSVDAVNPVSPERSPVQSMSAASAVTLSPCPAAGTFSTRVESDHFKRPHDPSHLHTFALLI
jgi:hypothetical protein